MKPSPQHPRLIIFLLGLLSAVGPFSIDMYLPAFEAIAKDFDTSVDKVQLSLSAFFVGIALGQLIYGPLLDKYGRKKPLIAGLCIYIITTFLCIFVKNIEQLIVLRFFQAIGSCSGMVAARAMVRDYYEPREAAKVFSMLMLVIGISPILAPSVGAFVMVHLHWHSIFIILSGIAFFILIGTIFFLPESYSGNKNMSLKPADIIRGFWGVFKNPVFFTYCLAGGIGASGLYAYLAGSSFVMQKIYHLSESQYGLVFAITASSLIIATQFNRFLLNRFSSRQISFRANIVQVFIGLLLLGWTFWGTPPLAALVSLVFLFLCGHGMIFPNTSALALAPFDKSAGSASALLGCVQMGIGALSSATVSILHNGTAVPMIFVMTACTLGCLAVFLISRMILGKKPQKTDL